MSDDWQYHPDAIAAWPAGWYADPWYPGQQRYWDGAAWTPHTVPPSSAAPSPTTTEAWAPPTPTAPATMAPAPTAPAPAAPTATEPTIVPPPTAAEPTIVAPPTAAEPTIVPAPPNGSPWTGDPTAPVPPPTPWGVPDDPSGTTLTPLPPAPDPWATFPAPPPRPAPRGGIPWVGVLVAMVVVAVIAGAITVVIDHHHHSPAASSPPTLPPSSPRTTLPTTPTTGAPQSSDRDASILPNLALGPTDVATGVASGLVDNGNLVGPNNGESTLDLCNSRYQSEAQRSARYQTGVADNNGNIVFSTEAVLYKTPGGTAEAFTELRSVSANCPERVVISPVGDPPVKTVFGPAPDLFWPQTPTVGRQAYTLAITDSAGTTTHSIAVYLRRGRVLLGLYFSNPSGAQPAIDGQTTIPGIVTLFAGRMAKIPTPVILSGGAQI